MTGQRKQPPARAPLGLAAALVALVLLVGGRLFHLMITGSLVTTIAHLVLLVLGILGVIRAYLVFRQ